LRRTCGRKKDRCEKQSTETSNANTNHPLSSHFNPVGASRRLLEPTTTDGINKCSRYK
jgi:hypothetical protein